MPDRLYGASSGPDSRLVGPPLPQTVPADVEKQQTRGSQQRRRTTGLQANQADTAGIAFNQTAPTKWLAALDLFNKVFKVSDGTYNRVQVGLVGSNYGVQLKDGAGNTTFDTATSDGRLKLQIGKSTTVGPVTVTLAHGGGQNTSANVDTSIVAITIPGNTLAVDGEAIRITVFARFTSVGADNAVNVKFGATIIAAETNDALATRVILSRVLRRTGAATQASTGHDIVGALTTDSKVYPDGPTTPGETLSGNVTLDIRGTAHNPGGSVYIDDYLVEYLGVV